VTTAPSLEARDLTVGYRDGRLERAVLSELSLSLTAGQLVCLIGPNGAGKSTLMRTLAGMQPPLAGTVLIDGVPIHRCSPKQRARAVGVVLTDRVQAPLMTVRELVELGRYPYTDWRGRLTAHDHDAVDRALAMTGADALADRLVNELSDGERQRALVARAVAQGSGVLLLDEVTAFLDLPRRVDVVRMLRSVARDDRRVILLSTHDLDLALRSAERIWLIDRHGGFVQGAPEELVLSGAFERAFAAEGVTFDPERGTFSLTDGTGRPVAVTGAGAVAFWTGHALERWGYRLAAGAHARERPCVPRIRWSTLDGHDPRRCDRL
jgi:iron complex transport system ATP-binding protein